MKKETLKTMSGKDNLNINNIVNRIVEPTPKFWKRVRNVAATVAAISGSLLAAPVALPAGIITALTYAVVVGGTIAGTSQMASTER